MLQKIKSLYLLWHDCHAKLPKIHRHSLGQKIDTLLIETIELIAGASFLARHEKQSLVQLAVRKTDTLKILFMVLWESKSIETKKYAALSLPLDEVGKMLGGWNGQLTKSLEFSRDKQNSPNARPGEK